MTYYSKVRNVKRFGLAILAGTTLAGCGGPEAALVGKWTATDLKMQGGQQAPEMFKQMLSKFTLELKPDRHFSFSLEDGSWTLDGSQLKLKPTSIEGKSIDQIKEDLKKQSKGNAKDAALLEDQLKEQIATVSADNKTITWPIKGGPVGEMNFTFEKARP